MEIEEFNHALCYFKEIASSELHTFIDALSIDEYREAYALITKARQGGNRVHVTGIGKPSYVAGYIASLMSSTGTPTYVLDATEAVHGSSGQVVEDDVVIAISNSGETQELKNTVITMRKNNAKVIAVSGNRESWLAKHTDAFLYAGVVAEGGPLNKAPRVSYLAEIIVLLGLSILLQSNENIDLNDYKRWHPGGSLGASIK